MNHDIFQVQQVLLPMQDVSVSAVGRDLHEFASEEMSLARQNGAKEGRIGGKYYGFLLFMLLGYYFR